MAVIIQYNASSGSNTAASGAGPTTAITGTNAAYSGDGAGGGTQTVITLTNTPDLSAVTTDHVLYLNTSTGERYMFGITAVNDGADTVTVHVAPTTAINSGSAVSYAIGGKRAGPRRSGTEFDFGQMRSGWTFSFDDGSYDITVTAASGTLDLNGGNQFTDWAIITPSAGIPADADSTGVTFTWTHDGNGEQLYFRCNWRIEGINFAPTTTGGSAAQLPVKFSRSDQYRCKWDQTGMTGALALQYANGGSNIENYTECIFEGSVYFGGWGGILCYRSIFRDGPVFGQNGFSPGLRVCVECIFYNANASFYGELRSHTAFINCTIYNAPSDGITAFSTGTPSLFVAKTTISDSAAYGIDYGSTNTSYIADWMYDYNHFYSNTSGNRSVGSATDNEQSGDPLFVSVTGGSEDFRIQPGSPLIGTGPPPLIR